MHSTDEIPLVEAENLRRGRLFKLKLKHNHAARQAALGSIRERPDRQWQARIGGRMRGATRTFPSRVAAEHAVNDHYNTIMHDWVCRGQA